MSSKDNAVASGGKDEDGTGRNATFDAMANIDDGVDAVLFLPDEDEAHNDEMEDDEGEEVDVCLVGGGGETEEEETGAMNLEVPQQQSQELNLVDKSSKRFRRHHFIKHEICIPDKARKPPLVPKGKPWYLRKKRGLLEKRQDSKIVFVMPKQEDPEVIALRRTNKMVQKLIKYMKKSWKVRIKRKQEERELEHRTLASVYTRKPDDWLTIIRKREERSLETGFFSPLDVPYESLIDLELDTALLTFKNLPPDLKITAARWIRTKLRKEELKRKRDAFLPRLPHGKVKRPSYNKGRLIKDPGGVHKVDQFAKVAENFHKVTKGNTPFSKVLKEWSQKKEKESYSLNSGFGVVREGMFDFSRKAKSSKEPPASSNEQGQNKSNEMDQRRVSIVDARKYQRDMLTFEKFIMAIYDIMKSLLNIKIKQLESKFPLPPTAVFQIRANSPDSSDRPLKSKNMPMLILQRNAQRAMRASRASIFGLGHRSFALSDGRAMSMISFGKSEITDQDDEQHNYNNPINVLSLGKKLSRNTKGSINARKSLSEMGHKNRRKSDVRDIIAIHGGAEGLKVEDVVNLSPVRSSTQVVDEIKREYSFQDMMEMRGRKQNMLTAEQKIKRLAENPEHAAIRRARNYMTYTKLFERNKKLKKPIWHNIDIAAMATDFKNAKGLKEKDPANLTEADAAEVVEMALKKRRTMSKKGALDEDNNEATNKRWPEEYDIPTPTFPFPHSKIKIPSEEQSRQNLLKKTPHMDEVPSTPVRRLYKLAGVRTTEMDIFNNIMEMKKMFRVTENKLRVYYENEIGKLDWDTLKRFRCKLNGMLPTPVFQWTISVMRTNQEQPSMTTPKGKGETSNAEEGEDVEDKKLKQKRPALWYKKLKEEAEMNGATRHSACHTELKKLLKYCDVDMKTKPHMLNRLALLVVSLPTTELGTKHWQQAIVFLLEHMFGTPPEIIHHWLKYRGIPFLL